MVSKNARLMLVGLAWLALWPAHAQAQYERWDSHMAAAFVATDQGSSAEAEKQFLAAIKEAEAFALKDPRLPATLVHLASLYHREGRLEEAEPLYRRVLAVRDQTLAPDDPEIARTLNSLGVVYEAQGRYGEVEPLYQRALAIRGGASS